jgi:nucleoid-associated protein YgaU
MHSPARSGSALLLILGLASSLAAQTPAPSTPPEAAPATPPSAPVPAMPPSTPAPATPSAAEKPAESETEMKLAVTLRSYSLLEQELDKVKAQNAQLIAEKTELEAKLSEATAAMPLAAQTVALRDQLRQTQAQMAAYAEENADLKNRLALGASTPGHAGLAPTLPAPFTAPAPVPAPEAKPAPRTHTIAMGDTLTKISQKYYGTPNRWNEILAANRDVLKDEKSLVVGKTLVIP